RRDFLLAEGGTDTNGEVAGGIQHAAAALGAGLPAAGTTSHHSKTGAWGCGKRCAFPTSPHPRLRLRTKIKRGVTLTFCLVQKIGQGTVRIISEHFGLGAGSLWRTIKE